MVEARDRSRGHGSEALPKWCGGIVDERRKNRIISHEAATATSMCAIDEKHGAVREDDTVGHCLRAVGEGVGGLISRSVVVGTDNIAVG